jgi:amino acid transporter
LIFLLGSLIESIIYTSSAVYTFYFATNLAVIVLRWKDRDTERPYRASGFPVTTLIFCAVCLLLIHAALTFQPLIGLAAFMLAVIGMGVFQFFRRPFTAIPHAILLIASVAYFRHIWLYYQAHQHEPDNSPYPEYSWIGIVVGFLLLVLYQFVIKDSRPEMAGEQKSREDESRNAP